MNKNIVIAGLPNSGKTTYLAALWYLLRNTKEARTLKAGDALGDEEYLNEICALWAAFETQTHTIDDNQLKEVSISIADYRGNSVGVLKIPDMRGEIYRDMWDEREVLSALKYEVQSSSGIMLFLNPFVSIESHTIAEAGPGDGKEVHWSASLSEHQVKTVQFLQDVMSFELPSKPLKLSVMISAWDKIKDLSPEEFLSSNYPLLDQFLNNNYETFESRVYGISSQGYEKKKITNIPVASTPTQPSSEKSSAVVAEKIPEFEKVPDEITKKHPLYKRCQLAYKEEEIDYDISKPLRWLLGVV